ncbi:MAG: peptidyl-prolyl cis-trans isomerase, partial [Planctomycetes bacterium]|nr:peptidyl-prolyl cis-trans isomerase [Planctomycetota bacterium]
MLVSPFVATAEDKPTDKPASKPANPRVKLSTTLGDIVLELDAEKAPVTVENFLAYVN